MIIYIYLHLILTHSGTHFENIPYCLYVFIEVAAHFYTREAVAFCLPQRNGSCSHVWQRRQKGFRQTNLAFQIKGRKP